jgi:hypothetical protein
VLGGAFLLYFFLQDILYSIRTEFSEKRKLFRDVCWYVFSRLTRPGLIHFDRSSSFLIALFYAFNGSRDRDSVGRVDAWRRERNRWWWEDHPSFVPSSDLPLFKPRRPYFHLSFFSETTDGYKCRAGRLRWWSVFLYLLALSLNSNKSSCILEKMMSFWVSSSNI